MLYPRAYACGMRKRVVVYRAANSGDPEERQIDALTALLLMPEDLLRQNLAEAGLPNGVSILAHAFRDEYLRFDSVRKQMGVSRQALAMRMQKLGLLGKNSLELPEIRCPGSW
jgi:Zn-dependent peptidase ImmA (M78 family)